MTPLKLIFIFLGSISLVIGIIGIVVPGLPTTPFLLLTAGLYVKSSDRLYNKLISNRFLGPYIQDYQRNKGMNWRKKIIAIGTMWVMILVSCIFFIDSGSIRLIVVLVGVVGTLVMGILVPTAGSVAVYQEIEQEDKNQ